MSNDVGPAMLQVLFVSTSYPQDLGDWRGLFIRHLAFALARTERVALDMWTPAGELPPNSRFACTADDERWFSALTRAGGIAHLIRSGGVSGLLEPVRLLRRLSALYRRSSAVELYHINWLQSAIPLPRDRKPALVTVLGSDLKLLRLPLVKALVRRALRGRAAMICPNAEWMEAPLRAAFGDVATVRTISFGVAAEWFSLERAVVGSAVPRWLAVTRLTKDKLGPLLDWGRPLFADGSRELHLFGPMQETVELPDWVRYHGPATPQQLLEDWFPSATGLITLSQHAEGRPQVMLEAMAAGLPIVASDLPAHAAFLRDRETGLLCSTPGSFADAVGALEDPSTNRRIGDAARGEARALFGSWDDCAQRYLAAYRQLMQANA